MRRRLLAAALALLPLSGTAALADSCAVPGNVAGLTAEIGRMLNADRARQGLPPLRMSRTLTKAAEGHACDMAKKGYFSHKSQNGATPKKRAKRVGYRACLIAENIAMGYSSPGQTHNAWMTSSGHRRNMLLRDVREFGLGIATPASGSKRDIRWVLVVARPC